jgi:3-hydroxyacyl-CoA dehydrogenase
LVCRVTVVIGVDSLLSKDVNKQKISENDKKEVLGRISTTISLDDLAEADFLIEVACRSD